MLGAGAVVATAVVAVAATMVLRPQAPAASGSPTPSSRPPSLEIGGLDIGSYAADQFQPPFDLVISDPGWSVYRSGPEYVGLYYDSQPQGHVDIGRVESVLTNPCSPDGETLQTGSTPLELLSALETIPYMTVSPTETTTIGGRSGVSANVDISEGALAACGSFGTGDVGVFPVGAEVWRAFPGERIRIKAVDVDGITVAVMLSAEAAAASSVAELEQFFQLADRLLEDLSF